MPQGFSGAELGNAATLRPEAGQGLIGAAQVSVQVGLNENVSPCCVRLTSAQSHV